MFGHLRLFNYELDLDAEWVAKQEFEEIPVEELPSMGGVGTRVEVDWRTCLLWIAPLLRHSLDSKASALYLFQDMKQECLRQFILLGSTVADGNSRFWFELSPMAWPMGHAGLRAVRFMSRMIIGLRKGTLSYVYQGKRQQAQCTKVSESELLVCLTHEKPTTFPNLGGAGIDFGRPFELK